METGERREAIGDGKDQRSEVGGRRSETTHPVDELRAFMAERGWSSQTVLAMAPLLINAEERVESFKMVTSGDVRRNPEYKLCSWRCVTAVAGDERVIGLAFNPDRQTAADKAIRIAVPVNDAMGIVGAIVEMIKRYNQKHLPQSPTSSGSPNNDVSTPAELEKQ